MSLISQIINDGALLVVESVEAPHYACHAELRGDLAVKADFMEMLCAEMRARLEQERPGVAVNTFVFPTTHPIAGWVLSGRQGPCPAQDKPTKTKENK